jgi:hypothetical protein
MTPRASFLDPKRQQHLVKLARGKNCGGMMRHSTLSGERFWRPSIGDDVVGDETFSTKDEAKAAAIRFRDDCREKIAQANGATDV